MDLSVERYSATSGTTDSVCNVLMNLDADQEDCDLHVLSLTIVYSTRSKENTKIVAEKDDVSISLLFERQIFISLTFLILNMITTLFLLMEMLRNQGRYGTWWCIPCR